MNRFLVNGILVILTVRKGGLYNYNFQILCYFSLLIFLGSFFKFMAKVVKYNHQRGKRSGSWFIPFGWVVKSFKVQVVRLLSLELCPPAKIVGVSPVLDWVGRSCGP